MKKRVVFGMLYYSLQCIAFAQIVLDAGASYAFDFRFTSGTVHTGIFLGQINSFTPRISGFESGDSVLLEMFDNNTNGAAFCSQLYSPGGFCQSAPGWDDLQGAVRVSVLSGSIVLEAIGVNRMQGIGGRPPLYISWATGVVPVPEPSTNVLFGMGLGFAIAYRFCRKRCSREP